MYFKNKKFQYSNITFSITSIFHLNKGKASWSLSNLLTVIIFKKIAIYITQVSWLFKIEEQLTKHLSFP